MRASILGLRAFAQFCFIFEMFDISQFLGPKMVVSWAYGFGLSGQVAKLTEFSKQSGLDCTNPTLIPTPRNFKKCNSDIATHRCKWGGGVTQDNNILQTTCNLASSKHPLLQGITCPLMEKGGNWEHGEGCPLSLLTAFLQNAR